MYNTTCLSRTVSLECRLLCCSHYTNNVLSVALGTKQKRHHKWGLQHPKQHFQTIPSPPVSFFFFFFLFVCVFFITKLIYKVYIKHRNACLILSCRCRYNLRYNVLTWTCTLECWTVVKQISIQMKTYISLKTVRETL